MPVANKHACKRAQKSAARRIHGRVEAPPCNLVVVQDKQKANLNWTALRDEGYTLEPVFDFVGDLDADCFGIFQHEIKPRKAAVVISQA